MNSQTRKELDIVKEKIREQLEVLQAISEEEQAKFDNLNEGLQATRQGEKFKESAQAIESVVDEIESQLSELDDL